jgi:hypothetical protein
MEVYIITGPHHCFSYFSASATVHDELGLIYDCSPLVPILWLSSPIYNARSLQILFSRIQPRDSVSAYSSSTLWFIYN